jgi:hypothetical protein
MEIVPINVKKFIYHKLRSHGFHPEYNNFDYYYNGLKKHLGKKNTERLLNNIDRLIAEGSINLERQINEIIKGDKVLLKYIYSTGIGYSVIILESIIHEIKQRNLNPNHIVELGGANGWALSVIRDLFKWEAKYSVVDLNPNWGIVEKYIEQNTISYSEFICKPKSDLVISIFGETFNNVENILKCASDSLENGGLFIGSLRIPNTNLYDSFVKRAKEYSLSTEVDTLISINIENEVFPIFIFSKI